ncbi:MAG: metal-dependent hydrolase [Nanoarchaeota archaeon]|nr:metal-dependent hydrolase [Nanoarchaeota archaeon]
MLLRTHLAFGLLVGLLSLNYLNVPSTYLFIIMVCFASALPDIDESDSRIGRKIRPISWFIEKVFGHRNVFHSIFPLLAMFITFFYILKWNVAGTAFLLGYSGHLFIDMFTYMGIGLLHPLYKGRITGFIKTGGIVEHVLFFILIFANILVLGWFF